MKIIKFLGKILSIPFGVTITIALIGLIPLKTINNWLTGCGEYNKLYWKYAVYVIKRALDAFNRKAKPTLLSFIRYSDDIDTVIFYNDRKDPNIIHIGKNETE